MNNSPAERECRTLLLQTLCCCPPAQHKENVTSLSWIKHKNPFNLQSLPPSYLEADILEVVGMPFNYLFDEVGMCGLQVRAGWLVQLKLKASPKLWHVKSLVPAPAHLWWQTELTLNKVL